MKIAPRVVLEEHARQEYRKRFGDYVPQKVRNAPALAALGEHRPLRFAGHYYRVPMLPWRAGVRLLAVDGVLREEGSRPALVAEAKRKAVVTLDACVVERRMVRRGLWFRREWLPPRKSAFAVLIHADTSLLRGVVGWFMEVPDEHPPAPTESRELIDLLQGFAAYMRSGWPVTPDGYPASWAHYQYCLRDMGRTEARARRQNAEDMRVAFGADEKAWKNWLRELRSVENG